MEIIVNITIIHSGIQFCVFPKVIMMNNYSHNNGSRNAFSMLEMVMVVSLIGIVSSVAIMGYANIGSSSRSIKLKSDVETLNRALLAYAGSGGALDEVTNASEAISRLKSSLSPEIAARIPGFAGSFADQRISYSLQDAGEAQSGALRALWDNNKKRFVIATSGQGGIRQFTLKDPSESDTPSEDNRKPSLLYAENSSWIWDYEDAGKAVPLSPTIVTVADSPTSAAAAIMTDPSVPTLVSHPENGILTSPLVSLPTGTYDISLFNFSVSLIDPNPAGAAEILYSIDHEPWQEYHGPFDVKPNSMIKVQAIAKDPGMWRNSSQKSEYYHVKPEALTEPVAIASATQFALDGSAVRVVISNPNDPRVSKIAYRVNGAGWTDYSSPLSLKEIEFPGGVEVEAKAVPILEYYLESSAHCVSVESSEFVISGNNSAKFSNPVGTSALVSNLAGGASSNYVSWGDDYYLGIDLSKSWLSYQGGDIFDVVLGERFQIGTLEYFNGKYLADTGASAVDLNLDLTLDINGTVYNPNFDFTFDLVNTVNIEDPNNPWPDADYVSINNPIASSTVIIDDYEYAFSLEFGEASNNGFALFDQFHVLEEKGAAVNTYGTLTRLGKIDEEHSVTSTGELDTLKSLYVSASQESRAAKSMAVAAEAELTGALDIYQNVQANGWVIAEAQKGSLLQARARAQIAAEAASLSAEEARSAATKAFFEAGKIAVQALLGANVDAEAASQLAQEINDIAVDARQTAIRAVQATDNLNRIIEELDFE